MTHVDIDALAAAARIALSENEKREYAREMGVILSLGERLCRETALCEEYPSDARRTEIREALREDVPQKGLSREELLAAAPTVEGGYVTVPRILSPEGAEEGEKA